MGWEILPPWSPQEDALQYNFTCFRCGVASLTKKCNKCTYINFKFIESPGHVDLTSTPSCDPLARPIFENPLAVGSLQPEEPGGSGPSVADIPVDSECWSRRALALIVTF